MTLDFGRSSHSSDPIVARVGALWHVFMKICTQIRINSIPHEIDRCMTIISSYTLNTENNLSLKHFDYYRINNKKIIDGLYL